MSSQKVNSGSVWSNLCSVHATAAQNVDSATPCSHMISRYEPPARKRSVIESLSSTVTSPLDELRALRMDRARSASVCSGRMSSASIQKSSWRSR